MKCPICGNPIGKNKTICSACGFEIIKNDIPKESITSHNEAFNEDGFQYNNQIVETPSFTQPSPYSLSNKSIYNESIYKSNSIKAKKNGTSHARKKGMLITLIVLGCMLLGLGITFLFVELSKKSKADSENLMNQTDLTSEMVTEQSSEKTTETVRENTEKMVERTTEEKTEKTEETEETTEDITTEKKGDVDYSSYEGVWLSSNDEYLYLFIEHIAEDRFAIGFVYDAAYIIEPTEISINNGSAEFSTGSSSGTIIFEDEMVSIHLDQFSDYLDGDTAIMDKRYYDDYSNGNFTPELWRINTVVDSTDVYAGPGYDYDFVCEIEGKQAVTIIDMYYEDGSYEVWGKLKSGIGWINLNEPGKEFVEYVEE